jgi:hypothetical protein
MARKKTWMPDRLLFSIHWTPDWRLRRATELFEESKAAKELGQKRFQVSKWREGQAVTDYVKYLRAFHLANDKTKRRQSFVDKYWHYEQAKAIFANELQHFEIELRIIADQSLDFIATKMHLKYETVRTYCCLYFDVRHPGDVRRFTNKIGFDLREDPKTPEEPLLSDRQKFGLFLRRYAISTSNLMISILIDAFLHYGEKHDWKTDNGYRRQHLENRYHMARLPGILDSDNQRWNRTISEFLNLTSSNFSSDFLGQCEEIAALNLLSLTSKKSNLADDYDAVAPKRSKQSLKDHELPSVTIYDDVDILEPTLATQEAEASNAA